MPFTCTQLLSLLVTEMRCLTVAAVDERDYSHTPTNIITCGINSESKRSFNRTICVYVYVCVYVEGGIYLVDHKFSEVKWCSVLRL